MVEGHNDILLTIRGLKTYFPVRGGGLWGRKRYVRAVDGVDLTLRRGRTLGLVGESGSGKTTVGRSILRLVPATAGEVNFDGQDVFALRPGQVRSLRRRMQVIFQDPMNSLNPRMTVGGIVSEPLKVHGVVPRNQRAGRVQELLERVGLSPRYAGRYPHEFSGGQRQRIGIARALASEPDFIVCDEPVSALDVSIQAQILNLLNDLQDQMGLSYLFIAHNLAVVEHFADDVAVMYLGRIVEVAPKQTLLDHSRVRHPYTRALLASIPQPDPTREHRRRRLPGEAPSPIHPPGGCPFHPRCTLTRELAAELPEDETAMVFGDGRREKICRRCLCEQPRLAAMPDDPTHQHACLMRQPPPEAPPEPPEL